MGVADRHHHRAGHAPLPGGPEGGADDPVHGLVDDRVGHDHDVILGAAQGLHALAGLGRPLVDELGHRSGADKRDRVDAGVVEDALHHLAAAVDEVDHAGRQAEGVELLEGDLLGERHLLGGLEHERVAAGDGEGQKPERDHGREVERHDRGAHADRLADRLGVDIAADVLEVAPLHGGGDGAGGLDHLDHARHLGAGVGDRLAHLGGDRAGEVLLAGDQARAELEQPLGAADGGYRAPLGQRRRGRR